MNAYNFYQYIENAFPLTYNFHWPSPVEVFVKSNRTIKVRKQSLCYLGISVFAKRDRRERSRIERIPGFSPGNRSILETVVFQYLFIHRKGLSGTFPPISDCQVTKIYHINCLYQLVISQYSQLFIYENSAKIKMDQDN